MSIKLAIVPMFFVAVLVTEPAVAVDATKSPDYNTQVAPIFRKYCNGCHNAEDAEGGLILENFAKLMRGGKKGVAVVPGKSEDSRLLLTLEKKVKPFMPPEGSEGPTEKEIALLKAWIDTGAKGPNGKEPDPTILITPNVKPIGKVRNPINAAAWSNDGKWIAIARYSDVEILDGKTQKPIRKLTGHAGHINDVSFSADGKTLIVAAGEVGLFGEVKLWNTATWKSSRTIRGHRDSLYSARLSPDGKTLATASYDQKIILWDATKGTELRTFTGHNGPVFDLAFDPTGKILASASGDRTVKLWDVAKGERLDTFGESEKDQYAVAFSPDGRFVVAGGVDNRIRMWEIRQGGKEGTSPIVYSRFAHEKPIIALVFSPNGKVLVSSSEDRTIKIWETKTLTQLRKLDNQSDWANALVFAPNNNSLLIGRLDGTLNIVNVSATSVGTQKSAIPITRLPVPKPHAGSVAEDKLSKIAETEPNDLIKNATALSLPATATGVLQPGKGRSQDVDLYRFNAKMGQTWIIETNAARQKSPADTKVEVLHANGRPVERLLLRAVRDSYVTFRPIDSKQVQIRVKNWEEMELNQFVYMAGEVCKWFRMPQGPDSGMEMYKINGKRKSYFDTSGIVHAKEDPIYIVEPYVPGTALVDNGLPVFPLYFSNDDDGDRKLGDDSRLRFTAPANGTYLVRVTDVRGFSGPDYKYSLTVRGPKPDFKVKINGKVATVGLGSGQRFTIQLERLDGFDGDVRFDISGMPPGFTVSTPIVVQAGHLEAQGVINTTADAKAPKKEVWSNVKITATAIINGKEVTKAVDNFGEVKLGDKPKAIVTLQSIQPAGSKSNAASTNELVIVPGATISAILRIDRQEGFKGELRFDVDNLPHGVIVDNLGLSGIMIREGETERQIFISASAWVSETTRWIHAVSRAEGKQSSLPILIHVRKPDVVATVPKKQK